LSSKDRANPVGHVNAEPTLEQLQRRFNMLDERLDNMDSILTSLVERVMHQPLSLEVPCPKCGQAIQINITGTVRLKA